MKTNKEAISRLNKYLDRLNSMLKNPSPRHEGIGLEAYKKWVNREISKTNNQIEKLKG